MYGIYLRWIRNINNSWSYIIFLEGDVVVEKQTGFKYESLAIKAGLTQLKQREKLKMEELEQELNDVNNTIERFLFGKPHHIGEFRTETEQEELDSLCERRDSLKEAMSFPPNEKRDNRYD